MNIELLLQIVEYTSIIKAGYIMIMGNYIYGTDVEFTYLKTIDNTVYDKVLMYNVNDMKNFIKNVLSTPDCELLLYKGNLYSINKNHINMIHNMINQNPEDHRLVNYLSNVEYIEIFNYKYYIRMNSMISNMNIILNNKILYEDYNLREDTQFESILEHKTADGVSMYRINRQFILSIFTNLLPINKGDEVSLVLYDIDMYKFLAKFSIMKKKQKVKIDIYIMYLYI